MFRSYWDSVLTLPQGYRLRPARADDLNQLVELLLASFYPANRVNRWLHPLMRMAIQEDIKRRLSISPHRYGCLVVVHQSATAGSKIVGTVEISLRSQFWQPLQPRRPYIANVAIEPYHRRLGLAQQMLLACESIGKDWGVRRLYLHVATDNPSAIALYRKIGYQIYDKGVPWRRRQMMVKELFL